MIVQTGCGTNGSLQSILPNTVSLVQEFCVDVSAYQPVQWVEREDQECDTIFVKKCDWKKEVIIEIHPTVKS